MKKIVVFLVVISIAIVAVGCFNYSNQGNNAGFEAFDGTVINPEVFRTGATRAEVLSEIRILPTDTQAIYYTVAWFDGNGVLELAAEAAVLGVTEWTVFYQSEDKVFITEWRDGIEFHRNMQPMDIIGMFGFNIYFLPSTHERNHPVFANAVHGRHFVNAHTLEDNSKLYFKFWRGNVGPTVLDGVYRQINDEFIRIF